MDFLEVMSTEVKYISRQGLTTFLVFTYPWIIILILAQAFSVAEFEKAYVAIASQYTEDLEKIKSLVPENIELIEYPNQESVTESVRQGNVTIGMSIYRDPLDNRLKVIFIQDPTKGPISSEIVAKIENMFGAESRRYIETKVVSLWKEMAASSRQLNESINQITYFKEELQNTSRELDEINKSIDLNEIYETKNQLYLVGVELNKTSKELDSLEDRIDQTDKSRSQIDSFSADLDNFDNKLVDTKGKLVITKDNIPTWRSKIQNKIDALDGYISDIDNYRSTVNDLKVGATPETLSLLSEIENVLTSARSELVSAKNDLIEADNLLAQAEVDVGDGINEIDIARTKISSAKSALQSFSSNMDSTISAARISINTFKGRISDFRSILELANKKLDALEERAVSLKNYIGTMKERMARLNRGVDSLETLLKRTATQMSYFAEQNPLDIAPPEMFGKFLKEELRLIEAFFPSIIAIVAMLSCLLFPMLMSVRQADEGIAFRYHVSATSNRSILLGRFLGNYLIGLFQAGIIVIFGVALLGISFGDLPSFVIAVLLIPAAFISIGLFLSFIVSRESTAVLVTLLIAIPMLFLCGVLIPIEHVYGIMKTVAENLPLTNVVDLVNKVTIKELTLIYAQNELLVIFGYIIIPLVIGYFLMQRRF